MLFENGIDKLFAVVVHVSWFSFQDQTAKKPVDTYRFSRPDVVLRVYGFSYCLLAEIITLPKRHQMLGSAPKK